MSERIIGLFIISILLLANIVSVPSAVLGQVPPSLVKRVVAKGSAFVFPEVEAIVSEALSMIPEEVLRALNIPKPTTGFILANRSGLYVVLSTKAGEGFAEVSGFMLKRSLNFRGFKLNIILAEEVEFTTKGDRVDISEILSSPEDYELRLVEVMGFGSQLPLIYDPDDGSNITRPFIIGYLSEEPLTPSPFRPKRVIRDARRLLGSTREIIKEFSESCLPYIGYDKRGYMVDGAEGMVLDGIIILPRSMISELLTSITSLKSIMGDLKRPTLYLVREEFPSGKSATLRDISEDPARFIGRVVSISVNGIGGRISVQESIRSIQGESTAMDLLLEAYISWDMHKTPSPEGVLPLIGALNDHQDCVYVNVNGTLEILGKVVNATYIDESLTSKPAIIIYSLRRVGDLKLEELSDECLQMLQDRLGKVNFAITNFMEELPSSIPIRSPPVVRQAVHPITAERVTDLPILISFSRKIRILIHIVRPGELIPIRLSNSSITCLNLTLSREWRDLNITIVKLMHLPQNIPAPGGIVYSYHEIEVSVPNRAISQATIGFWVAKEWIERIGAAYSDVVLMKYSGGRWEVLETDVIGENVTHVYYRSITSSFSILAVTIPVTEELNFINLSVGLTYEGKYLGELARDIVVDMIDESGRVVEKVAGVDRFSTMVRPGTYTLRALWKGVLVAEKFIDLSAPTSSQVFLQIPLKLTDVSFTVVDMLGKTLKDVRVEITPDMYGGISGAGGVVTITAMVVNKIYMFRISWCSPVYGTEASTTITDTPEGLKARGSIKLPVGSIVVNVVDPEGRPVNGAEVTLGKVTKVTDAAGNAYFEEVPLEEEGAGISYDVKVKWLGHIIFTGIETVSRSRMKITEIAELFTMKLRVVDMRGRGVPYAEVVLMRGGAIVGSYATDGDGFVEISQLPLAEYQVVIKYRELETSKTILKDEMLEGKLIEIRLPTHVKPTSIQESTTMITSPLKQASPTREAAAEGILMVLLMFTIITAVSVACIITIVVVLRKMRRATVSN